MYLFGRPIVISALRYNMVHINKSCRDRIVPETGQTSQGWRLLSLEQTQGN